MIVLFQEVGSDSQLYVLECFMHSLDLTDVAAVQHQSGQGWHLLQKLVLWHGLLLVLFGDVEAALILLQQQAISRYAAVAEVAWVWNGEVVAVLEHCSLETTLISRILEDESVELLLEYSWVLCA